MTIIIIIIIIYLLTKMTWWRDNDDVVQDRTEYDDQESDEIASACSNARRANGKANECSPMARAWGQCNGWAALIIHGDR